MIRAVVVGAGHAGMAVSWHLARRGVEHAVLEAERIGESWRSQRWDSFALNTPTWSVRLPGDPAGGSEQDPDDGFLSRDAWVAHLDAYARMHALPVRTGVRVTGLSPRPGGGFTLSTAATDPSLLEADAVIVASGMQRVPRLPAVAAGVPAGVASIHTAAYRRPEALPPGGVLVVGCAQSGGQIAEELLAAGRRVVVAASPVPRVPRRYRGRDIFEWARDTGFLTMSAEQLPDPRMKAAPQPIVSGIGRYGHTLSLQRLAASGAQLTGRLARFDGGVARFADDLPDSVRAGDRASAEIRAGIDRAIEARGLVAVAADADPDPDDLPVADPDGLRGPRSLDLPREGIGTVIWATGFRPDVAWMGPSFVSADGSPIADGSRGPVPGLWYLGIPWQRARSSAIVAGADQDAAAVADAVVAHLR